MLSVIPVLRKVLTDREGCAAVFDLTDLEVLESAEGFLAEDGELIAKMRKSIQRQAARLDELLVYLAGQVQEQAGAEVSAPLLHVQGRLAAMRNDLLSGKVP